MVQTLVMLVAVLGSVAMLALAAIKCFQIKYSDSKHNKTLQDRLDKLEATLREVGAEKIESLEMDVKMLKNMNNMAPRTKR